MANRYMIIVDRKTEGVIIEAADPVIALQNYIKNWIGEESGWESMHIEIIPIVGMG